MYKRQGLHRIDWAVPKFEIGYWARTSHAGRGYITEDVYKRQLLSEVERGGLLRVDAPLNVPHFWQFMTVSALLRAAARRGEVVDGLDLDYLGEALLAPLQIDIFRYQRDARGYSLERIADGLRGLVGLLAR